MPYFRERDKKGTKDDINAAIPSEIRTRRATIKMNRSGKPKGSVGGEGVMKPSSSDHEMKKLTVNEPVVYEGIESKVTTSKSVPEFHSNRVDNDPSMHYENETSLPVTNNTGRNQCENITEENEEYVEKGNTSQVGGSLEYDDIELQKQQNINFSQKPRQQTLSTPSIKEENEEYVQKAIPDVKGGGGLEYEEIHVETHQQQKPNNGGTSPSQQIPSQPVPPPLYDTPPDAMVHTEDEPPPVPVRRDSIRQQPTQPLEAPPHPPRQRQRGTIDEEPKKKKLVRQSYSVADIELPAPPILSLPRSNSVSDDILPPLLDAASFLQTSPNDDLPPAIGDVTQITANELQSSAGDLPPAIGDVTSDVAPNEYSAMEFQSNSDSLPPVLIGDINNVIPMKDNEYSSIQFPPSSDNLPPIVEDIPDVTRLEGNNAMNSDTSESASVLPLPDMDLPLPDTLLPHTMTSSTDHQTPAVEDVIQQLPPDIGGKKVSESELSIADMQLLPPIDDLNIANDTPTGDFPAFMNPFPDFNSSTVTETTELPPLLPDMLPDPPAAPGLVEQQSTPLPTIEVQVLRQNLPPPTSTDHIESSIDQLQFLLANDDDITTAALTHDNDTNPDWLTKQTGIEQLHHFLLDASY